MHSNKSDYGGSNTPVEIRDSWQTPMWLWNPLNDIYHFDIDVAASHENHLCDNYFTIEHDALNRDWVTSGDSVRSSVWCNPPYSKTGNWVDKAAIETKKSTWNRIVMIVPADTSTKWFQKALETCSEIILLVGGRVNFVRADTKEEVKGNTKGSMLLIWCGITTGNCNITHLDIKKLKEMNNEKN